MPSLGSIHPCPPPRRTTLPSWPPSLPRSLWPRGRVALLLLVPTYVWGGGADDSYPCFLPFSSASASAAHAATPPSPAPSGFSVLLSVGCLGLTTSPPPPIGGLTMFAKMARSCSWRPYPPEWGRQAVSSSPSHPPLPGIPLFPALSCSWGPLVIEGFSSHPILQDLCKEHTLLLRGPPPLPLLVRGSHPLHLLQAMRK